ncbi:lysozyme [Falsigemmobacter faecalis]|uniref:Lysozyme n=1 Tax=Falsigemmobacter faecalis TaxID=2488730 RepID=A0A3P3DUP9_9RHOB|nr:lysozyme [Falsigemmobacter faecalis]RRH76428.1 lysozyme [Falsigemmobacter faecalis]
MFAAVINSLFQVLLGRRSGPAAEPAPLLPQAAILLAAAAFVMPWEGLRTEAYLDRLAEPPVWTLCYGETRGVSAGMQRSRAECERGLLQALDSYHQALAGCLPGFGAQPTGVQVALTSWSYNVGTGAACGSTLVRLARAGDWAGACSELPRWNRAGGRVIAGLTARRLAETAICLNALPKESRT